MDWSHVFHILPDSFAPPLFPPLFSSFLPILSIDTGVRMAHRVLELTEWVSMSSEEEEVRKYLF